MMVTEKNKQYHREYSSKRRLREWLLKNVTIEKLRNFYKDLGGGSHRGPREDLIQKIITILELMK